MMRDGVAQNLLFLEIEMKISQKRICNAKCVLPNILWLEVRRAKYTMVLIRMY